MQTSNIIGKSLGEIEVLTFIQTIYQGRILSGYKHPKVKKELDIYLPDVQIGFEYNGAYWHSDRFVDTDTHLVKKRLYEKEAGIIVYFISSLDWTDPIKRKIIENRIRYILGQLSATIYARKTKLLYPSEGEEREFLIHNHLDGYQKSDYRVALQYKDSIVSLLSVNVVDDSTVEICRFSNLTKTKVVGGFSKLLATARTDISRTYPTITEILVRCNRTLSRGKVFVKNGFAYQRSEPPTFYYVWNGKKYPKDSLDDDILTNNPSIYKVWNVGYDVYTLDLTKPSERIVYQEKFYTNVKSYHANLEDLTQLSLPPSITLDDILPDKECTLRKFLVTKYIQEGGYQDSINLNYQSVLDDRFGTGTYKLLSDYIDVLTTVTILDIESGLRKSIAPKSLTTNGKFKVPDIFQRLATKYDNRFKPDMDTFKGIDSNMTFYDNLTGETFTSTPRGLERRKSIDDLHMSKLDSFKHKVKSLYGDEYIVLTTTEISSMEDNVEIYSRSLNETRAISPHNFLSNKGFKMSRLKKGELKFDKLLKEYGYIRVSPYQGLKGLVTIKNTTTNEILHGTANSFKLKFHRYNRK